MATPLPALCDPIVAPVDAEWYHGLTGYAFEPEVAGFARLEIQDLGKAQLDISSTYSDEATQTEATVYLFHAGLADASVWHDRILATMASGKLGTLGTAAANTTIFTPPSGQPDAGIRTVAPLSGESARSTGVAIYPFADWLLAVRMTSHSLQAADLDTRLSAFVTAFSAPHAPIGAAKAYAIKACDNALPQKTAKIYKPTMMDALLGATIGAAPKDETYDSGALPAKDADWCRDPASTADYGVYRSKGTRKHYIVAVSDAGMTASVGEETLSGLVNESSAPSYQMIVRTVDHAYAYPRFTRLPSVKQVMTQIIKGQPISSATRGAAETTINLPSPTSGKDSD
ncbi:hypothetical protein I5E68_09275 [Novosphingobium sp. YJ-S2-02]|uniref:Uncharacterized protein n=1 Tax=Novosphingobium aureum TaxID=2792964 RepID=A0A931HBV1_9SPHN|nr:hypothetical protein [Novosphingobium aureum]MBH0113135.1 hypothetical protein [Novosphingobium aureum]